MLEQSYSTYNLHTSRCTHLEVGENNFTLLRLYCIDSSKEITALNDKVLSGGPHSWSGNLQLSILFPGVGHRILVEDRIESHLRLVQGQVVAPPISHM